MTTRVLFALFLVTTASLARAEDWPRWRGVRGNGSWYGPTIPEKWSPQQGEPIWESPIGPGYSGISVSGGRVYTMDRITEPREVERVLCFDAAKGEILWQDEYPVSYEKLDYGKGPRTTPTIHEGRVYTLGAVGHLRCSKADTGELLWSKDLKADYEAQQPTWGFSSAPVIHDDLLIVHAGCQPNGCYVAFDASSGKERWRNGSDPTGYGTPIVIASGDATQLVGWTPEHVIGMDVRNGKQLWQIPYKVTYGVSIATPIFHQQTVLVCGYWEGSKAIRLGNAPGESELLWEENRYLRGIMSQPLCRDGYVYLLDKSHGLVCFELATGKVQWTDRHQLTARGRNPQVTLVWLGDSNRALALNAAGELVQIRLSPKGMEELDRMQIIGETWAHPAYAGDFVFARDDQKIVCVKITQLPKDRPSASASKGS